MRTTAKILKGQNGHARKWVRLRHLFGEMVSHLMREARGEFCHPKARVLQRRGKGDNMGGAKSANHSMELSTRNVIAMERTGLMIRSSVDLLDIAVGGLDGWICSAGTAEYVCLRSLSVSLGTAGGIEREIPLSYP